jgi:peptidoglycan/LPS O-acetylase OafA/YrhL
MACPWPRLFGRVMRHFCRRSGYKDFIFLDGTFCRAHSVESGRLRLPKKNTETDLSGDRRGQVDSLRALAIFCVLYDHFSGSTTVFGPLGVRLFFIISGYLITKIVLRARNGVAQQSPCLILRNFYIRRMLRIWPAYMIVLVGVWIAADQAREVMLWHAMFLTNILFSMRNDWGPPWMLGHLWTLSVQEQYYLISPLVMLLLPRSSFVLLVILGFVCCIIFRAAMFALGMEEHVAAYAIPLASIDALGVGACLSLIELTPGLTHWLRPMPLVTAALGSFMLVLQWLLLKFDVIWLVDVLLPSFWLLPLCTLLVGAVHGYAGMARVILGNRLLRYLGRISLGIYLYHLPIWALIFYLAGRLGVDYYFRPGWLAISVGIPATIAAASVSWRIVEEPLNALKIHFPYRSRESSPVNEV